MKNLGWCVSLLMVLGAPVLLSAKGLTTRITVKGPDLSAPVEITDPKILGAFNVWAGAGVRVNNIPQRDGFIIDWASGVVAERPNGLRRYEVSFYVKYANRPLEGQQEQLAYVVLYEPDAGGERGYVYLPGRADEWYGLNTRAIHRGLEGKWFRATNAWQRAVSPLLSQLRQR